MDRIVWKQRTGLGVSGWTGTVGRLQLFTVSRSMVRGEGWKLSTRLPWHLIESRSCGAEDAVKAYAEQVVSRFLMATGAVWPDREVSDAE
jgi:hypothetical protein